MHVYMKINDAHRQNCNIIGISRVLEPAEGADVIPSIHWGCERARGEWVRAVIYSFSCDVNIEIGSPACERLKYKI